MPIIELLDAARHDRRAFDSGEPFLDLYLQQQATQHHREGISTTHVLIDEARPADIIGYYTLAAAQMLLTDLQENDRRRLPRYPVPAIRLGRLAVNLSVQGRGHGELLLGHAVARCLALREQLGVRVLLVDALHERAAGFYQAYGFRLTTAQARTLYLPLNGPR